MKTKFLKLSSQLKVVLIVILISTYSCEKEDDISIQNEIHEKNINSKFYNINNLPDSEQVKPILTKLKNNLSNSLLNKNVNIDSVFINTDEIMYVDYADTHTLTFNLIKTNPEYPLENIVLHYNIETNSYDEYLVQYDISLEQLKHINEGNDLQVDDESQMIIRKIENGTLSSIMEKSCDRYCSTIDVMCAQDLHSPGETCLLPSSEQPYTLYVNCTVTCVDPPTNTIDVGDSSGGGGSNSNVITNPNTKPLLTPATPQIDDIDDFVSVFLDQFQRWWWNSQTSVEQKDKIEAFLEENKVDDIYTDQALDFAVEVIVASSSNSFEVDNFDFYEEIFDYYEGNPEFDDKALEEAILTLYTIVVDPPWVNNTGFYNNLPSLEYTATRSFTYKGVPITQFKLTNGDVISQGDYGQYESDIKIFYYSQDAEQWFEMPEPSTYDPLNVNFIFDHFWEDAALPFARYFTPIEEGIILIEGKDFDGVAQSQATAGLFILVDLVPGGKVLKITRKAGHTLSAASPVIRVVIDATTKSQKAIKKQYKNSIAFASNARKGNFGEICTDIDFVEKGYEVVHVNRHTTIDPIGDNTGIDHIFKNPVTNEYVIVESKFHGTGGLAPADSSTGLARQMSDEWIRGTNPSVLDSNNRLFMALGEDANLYNQVVNNYERVISYIQANGTINYKYVSETGYEINIVFNN